MNIKFLQQVKSFQKSVCNLVLTPQERQLLNIAQNVTNKKLSYLGTETIYELIQLATANEKNFLAGAIIETGCALGGSAIALACAKSKERSLFVYDAFDMIPPPSPQDGQDVHERYEVIRKGKSVGIGGETYYGYIANLYDKVRENFASYGLDLKENNIQLVKGFYEDTLQIQFPVSLAHIDCDWFDSVLISLQRIEPNLVRGGTLVIDDYHAYSGCKKAVDEYFKDKQDAFKFVNKSRLQIIKK